MQDNSGNEIYFDISLTRETFDELILDKINESINATRETLQKAGLTSHDIEKIVFVGGPTKYKPLRDKVAFELGIAPSTDVNPMTAVAEGAAIFAESIDWSTQNRTRKSSRGNINAGGNLELGFHFVSRTPNAKTKIVAKVGGKITPGTEFQIDNLDTGWSSGKVVLQDNASIEVLLSKPGENTFKVFIFDTNGGPLKIENTKLVITRTAASVDAIPASHSIGLEVKEKIGGQTTLEYWVREGDQLPKEGTKVYKAAESLKAGTNNSIKFKLWEGDIAESIIDNRFIGMFEIKGSDLEDGVISAGAELVCKYEILDSGNIHLEVSVPSIGGLFNNSRNFYSRQEGQINYSDAAKLVEGQSADTLDKLNSINSKVNDLKLDEARKKLEFAENLDPNEADPEKTKAAMDAVHDAKKLMSLARKEHLSSIRQMELDSLKEYFENAIRKFARPSEETAYENLIRTSQKAIEKGSREFEILTDEMRYKNWQILWRQDWFVVDKFNQYSQQSHLFSDKGTYEKLLIQGNEALASNDMETLRSVTSHLGYIKISSTNEDDIIATSNIISG